MVAAGSNVLRLQGLPFSASRKDLEQFFAGYGLTGKVHLQADAFGQATGIGFVEFLSEGEAMRARADKHMQHMGNRYIELMEARPQDIDMYFAGSRPPTGNVVRCQGLPFSASKKEFEEFFAGFGLTGRFHIQKDPFGYPTGVGLVEFTSQEEAQRAKAEKHMQNMGSRYIELLDAREQDVEHFSGGKPSAASLLRLQGLPFSASKKEIEGFFAGYSLTGKVHIEKDAFGYPTGIGLVEFTSQEEAQRARADKHMQNMGNRYIELLDARPQDVDMFGGGGGGQKGTDSMMEMMALFKAFQSKGGGKGKGGDWGSGGWDKSRAPSGKVLRVQGIPWSTSRQDMEGFCELITMFPLNPISLTPYKSP